MNPERALAWLVVLVVAVLLIYLALKLVDAA